jgi:hypothetical protein
MQFDAPDTPDLSADLTPRRKSVETAEQALAICRRLDDDNEERVKEYASIRAKYDGIEPPFSNTKMQEEGKEYKSNIPTGFLASICNTVMNRIVMRLKRTQYLSGANLPNHMENAVEKSETFRREFTKLMRNWRGFPFFVSRLALEATLCGKTFVGFDGPSDWKPRVFRIDDCAIPNGVQQGDVPPFVRLRKVYTVSEMFDFIRDKEVAEDAGWNIDNMVEAINDAHPLDDEDQRDVESASLSYEDMERQLIPSYAYSKGANSVIVERLLVQEYDGTVSEWRIDQRTGKELFYAESIYQSMNDAVQYACYEIGDGSVYGSNGVGQKIYDLAVNVEKSRNYSVDQLRNAGKFNIQVPDSSQLNSVELQITDDANYLAGGVFSGNTAALPTNVDAYIAQDRYFRGMAEEKIGAFTPESQATEKTATQSQIDALKEQETRDSVIDTFLTFFGHIMAMVQRRAGVISETNTDPQLVEFQEACLREMSVEEFTYLVNRPPAQTTIDFTDITQGQQAQFLQTKIGNPAWNQYLVERTVASLIIGPELTQALMNPSGMNVEQIEASRQQMIELMSIQQGIQMPVSPRDAHIYHMQVLSGQMDPQTQTWNGAVFGLINEGQMEPAMMALQHYIEHFQAADAMQQLGESQNDAKRFIAAAGRQLQRMQQQAQAQAQQQAQMAQMQQMQGQPMGGQQMAAQPPQVMQPQQQMPPGNMIPFPQ